MAEGGQYQGSQAFAHILSEKHESINPNTGSLNFVKPLVELRGVRSGIDLNVSVSYADGESGTFGLPQNWSLNLPYVIPGKSVTTQGRTYAIDNDWSDELGYQSGMRYINNHGMKFENIVPAQPLPSGLYGEYSYQLRYADGSIDYFDVNGKPMQHEDIYGNFIYYGLRYGHNGDVTSNEPCLEYIRDSWGSQISFSYFQGAQLVVTLPSGLTTTIEFSPQGVWQITDFLGYKTYIEYTPFQERMLIGTITHPTGLVSRFDYIGLDYLGKENKPGLVPAVQDHYKYDDGKALLERTNYRYGSDSGGQTFTGFHKGYSMGGNSDSIMEGGDPTYSYDVFKTSYDKDDRYLAATQTFFNYLHLPIQEYKYLLDDTKLRYACYSSFEYQLDINKHARSTSYSQPIKIEKFFNVSSTESPSWRSLNQTARTYDSFGNIVTESEQLCTLDGIWQPQKSTSNTYFLTKLGIQFLQTETVKDEISGSVQVIENTFTPDEKSVQTATLSFAAAGEPTGMQPKPWKMHFYDYDSQGRVTTDRVSWASGASSPSESASSSSRSTAYEYNNGILREHQQTSNSRATIVEYDMRITGGPIVRQILPQGQNEFFEYDAAGRQIKHVDYLGNVTSTEYTCGPSKNSEKIVAPEGYTQIKIMDALGRVTEVKDNGDPTQQSSDVTRTIERTTYDCQGRISQTVDKLGLVSSREYDALDRPLSSTDPAGNVSEIRYNDSEMRSSEYLNGELRTVSYLDGDAKVIRQVRYPDSGDTTIDFFIEVKTSWDGHKRKTTEITSEKSRSVESTPPKVLKEESKTYDPNSTVMVHSIRRLGDNGFDSVKRTYQLDLFGNTYTYTKETVYADGTTFSVKGPITVYNSDNELIKLQNQIGQIETYEYDGNGYLSTVTRFDGTKTMYTRNAGGQVVSVDYAGVKSNLKYASRDKIVEIQQADQTVRYEYSLDGSLTSTHFNDGRTISYELDSFSRVVSETDVFGVSRRLQFSPTGRVSSLECQEDKVEYVYGTANHTQSQLLGVRLSGRMNYEQNRSYDGFGELRQATTRAKDGKVLLDITYLMNSSGQLQASEARSEVDTACNNQRKWFYDGIGQLIREEIVHQTTSENHVTSYAYDGNSNVVATTVNGTTSNMTFNEIDQRIDSGFQYDTNGRLVKDGRGRTYTYDEKDRLKSVQLPDSTGSQFTYHADDFLGYCRTSQNETHFYHSQGKHQAMETADVINNSSDRISVVSGVDTLVATYTDSKSPKYYLDDRGSTAAVLDQDRASPMLYRAYGEQISSLASPQKDFFGFCQDFTEQTTGLVYLRSRYFDPANRAFLTMDAHLMENRYAYCNGDPVNNVDPYGHDFLGIIGLIVGFITSIAVSVVTLGAATPAVSAAMSAASAAVIGADIVATSVVASTAVSVVAGAIAGAAGSLAGSFATKLVTQGPANISYEDGELGRDTLFGFLGGAAGAGALAAAGRSGLTAMVRASVGTLDEAAGSFVGTINKGANWAVNKVIKDSPKWVYGSGTKMGLKAAFPVVGSKVINMVNGSAPGSSTSAPPLSSDYRQPSSSGSHRPSFGKVDSSKQDKRTGMSFDTPKTVRTSSVLGYEMVMGMAGGCGIKSRNANPSPS